MATNEKKRHHYIPKAYLRAFCDASGKFWVFPKDDPQNPFNVGPGGIAHERYYYSQPLPDGGQDNNRLEDLFAKTEAEWPPVVEQWRSGDPANDKLTLVLNFLALMRVRIPAARDVAEAMRSNLVETTMRSMHEAGKLPPLPAGHEDLLDHVEVSIDPHQSIHAMAPMMEGVERVLDAIGFEIVLNDTGTPFLTSDNPVAYFDPDIPEAECRPYTTDPLERRIELLFPVAPAMLLRGHSGLRKAFVANGLLFRRTTRRQEVFRYNRTISRFGYRFVFSSDRANDQVISRFANSSPVPDFQNVDVGPGKLVVGRMVFGKRMPKPKWTGVNTVDDGSLDRAKFVDPQSAPPAPSSPPGRRR